MSFTLRVEVSGLVFFAWLDNPKSLYALLVKHDVHTHKPCVYVHGAFLANSACKGTAADNPYVEFPIGGHLTWPQSVDKPGPPPFPRPHLTNLVELSKCPIPKGILASPWINAIIPLNFGHAVPSFTDSFVFDYCCDEDGKVDKVGARLGFKFAFETKVNAPDLELALTPNCTIHVQPVDGEAEIRIKNLPPTESHGHDPTRADKGDVRHFKALYKLLDCPGMKECFPFWRDDPNFKCGGPFLGSFYTCMPGGGS